MLLSRFGDSRELTTRVAAERHVINQPSAAARLASANSKPCLQRTRVRLSAAASAPWKRDAARFSQLAVMRHALALALAVLCLLHVGAAAPPRWHELQGSAYGAAEYVRDFGRSYSSDAEAARRHALIESRLAAIRAHNAADAAYKKVRVHVAWRSKRLKRLHARLWRARCLAFACRGDER
jgi:hypothetical protein